MGDVDQVCYNDLDPNLLQSKQVHRRFIFKKVRKWSFCMIIFLTKYHMVVRTL